MINKITRYWRQGTTSLLITFCSQIFRASLLDRMQLTASSAGTSTYGNSSSNTNYPQSGRLTSSKDMSVTFTKVWIIKKPFMFTWFQEEADKGVERAICIAVWTKRGRQPILSNLSSSSTAIRIYVHTFRSEAVYLCSGGSRALSLSSSFILIWTSNLSYLRSTSVSWKRTIPRYSALIYWTGTAHKNSSSPSTSKKISISSPTKSGWNINISTFTSSAREKSCLIVRYWSKTSNPSQTPWNFSHTI